MANKVHVINTRSSVMVDLIEKDNDNKTFFNELYLHVDTLCKQLNNVGIHYSKLKKLLIPANNGDIAFIFNWETINDSTYGENIVDILMPFIKDNNFCYLHGDYGFITDNQIVQLNKFNALKDALYNKELDYIDPSLLYIVYVTNVGIKKAIEINKHLSRSEISYVGFADLNNNNLFKTFLSVILSPSFIKLNNNIIQSDPNIDCCEITNDLYLANIKKHIDKIKIINVPEYYHFLFLDYRIPAIIEPQYKDRDLYYSFKYLEKNIENNFLENFEVVIDDGKLGYIFDKRKFIVDKWNIKSHEELRSFLIEKIRQTLIFGEVFNLEIKKEYNTCQFDICIEHMSKKYIIGLKLVLNETSIKFITICPIKIKD